MLCSLTMVIIYLYILLLIHIIPLVAAMVEVVYVTQYIWASRFSVALSWRKTELALL